MYPFHIVRVSDVFGNFKAFESNEVHANSQSASVSKTALFCPKLIKHLVGGKIVYRKVISAPDYLIF
jgi:hypothetical protein